MSKFVTGIFDFHDKLQMDSLNHRLARNKVITGNVANAETPGFRAIGYSFEEQLASLVHRDDPMTMKTTNPKHFRNEDVLEDGTLKPDVFVRPSESITEDGNTVDMDQEMAKMSENNLLYQATTQFYAAGKGLTGDLGGDGSTQGVSEGIQGILKELN